MTTHTADHTPDSTANALLTAALEAAERGWPVFPCAPGSKRPAVRAWNTRATTDPTRIRACWNSRGDGGRAFNIGIACGPADLVVVDCDVAAPDETHPDGRLVGADGWSGLDALTELAAGRALPATFTVATPSGGRHLYFRAPAGPGAVELRNTAGALGWKLDTRASGGYVLAPGSRLPHGTYRALPDAAGEAPPGGADAVSELPQWLADALTPTAPPPTPPRGIPEPRAVAAAVGSAGGSGRVGRYLDAAISAEVERVVTARAGARNRDLYIASVALGQLAAGGALPDAEVARVLLDAAAGHIANGAFSDRQARETIASGLRAGARRPRTLGTAAAGVSA